MYSSLPQLEPNIMAIEVTLFNSDMPERFSIICSTKFMSKRSGSSTRRNVGQSSIRHSKIFSVPVQKVTLRTAQNKESKICQLKKQCEELSKL